jgi:flagellar basal-body rod protein FlgB
MSSMDAPPIKRLEHLLDLSAYRQGLTTSNPADIDTPGYGTRDIDFADELRKVLGAEGEAPVPGLPQVVKVAELLERPDGNNVSVDRESMPFTETQLQFRMGACPKRLDPAVDKAIAMLQALKGFRRRSGTEDAPFESNIEVRAFLQK